MECKLTENIKDLVLVKYYQKFKKIGALEGLFICTNEQLCSLKYTEVYFGDVLGKNSEVYGYEIFDYCTVIETDENDIINLLKIFNCKSISGYNPIAYIKPVRTFRKKLC